MLWLQRIGWLNFLWLSFTTCLPPFLIIVLCLYIYLEKLNNKGLAKYSSLSLWLKDPRCEEVVKRAWVDGLLANSEFPLSKCLELCRSSLDAWNTLEFGYVGRQIDTLQKHLEWLELQPMSPGIIFDLRNTRAELNS